MKAEQLHARPLKVMSALFATVILSCAAAGARADDRADAQRLVREAIEADMRGQREQRDTALNRAVRIAPDYALAHWHRGEIQVGGEWTDLDQAQLQAISRGRIAQYQQLRDVHATSLQGHRLLARYCRKHALKDRERLHWYAILQAQPGNIEAIRCLGLLPYRGTLLTQEQIDQLETAERQRAEAGGKWRPILTELGKTIEKGATEERRAALEQIRAIEDPGAVFFAQQILSGRSDELTLELIALLGRIENPWTTNLLVNHAVMHESAAVRDAATTCLKERSWFTFVPTLMGALATPIEISFSATPMADGMYACVSFSREGPLAEYSQDIRFSDALGAMRGDRGRWLAERASSTANRMGRQIVLANAQTESRNQRIDAVLRQITGHETDGHAQSWWEWWQEYNDLYVPEDKPLVESETIVTTHECFLPGTPVWTETGPEPIERVQVGDRVLAQDPTTGELAYKLVLQTTVRPIGETVRVGVDGEDIYATNGHPFWVIGKGWRMARKLEPGWRLHTPTGSRVISHVEEGPESSAHNMMVEDFRCFFVGNNRILVHDNTVRRPTAALVPGVRRP